MTSQDAARDSDRDAVRAVVVEAYDVVDAPPRRELMALVELAARAAGVEHARVNLFTEHVQHSVAIAGEGPGAQHREMSREEAPCHVALDSGEPVMVEDARDDPRLADLPAIQDGVVRFYGSMPLRTPSGVVIGALCVYQDETRPVTEEAAESLAVLADRVVDVLELELASRRLGEANDRLTRSNERLAHFAGQVSHDLKNPLTSVTMSLEMLELELEEQPDLASMVTRARRGAERMDSLISELLDFAARGRDLEQVEVDLDAELDCALDDLAGVLDRDAVVRDHLPMVQGDADQLRSVLMNLLGNAAKFTRDGDAPQIEVAALVDGEQHRIEVRDRGRGVPEADRDRVFLPLTRLDKSVDGSGIGLATCRRVVEAHGGRIGVDPRPGGGSVFWWTLPAVPSPDAEGS